VSTAALQVLELQEVDQPVPNADEVLARVLAAPTACCTKA
jgi:NADPH:quinone reductase-like Zn-dependent oxidoreductase